MEAIGFCYNKPPFPVYSSLCASSINDDDADILSSAALPPSKFLDPPLINSISVLKLGSILCCDAWQCNSGSPTNPFVVHFNRSFIVCFIIFDLQSNFNPEKTASLD